MAVARIRRRVARPTKRRVIKRRAPARRPRVTHTKRRVTRTTRRRPSYTRRRVTRTKAPRRYKRAAASEFKMDWDAINKILYPSQPASIPVAVKTEVPKPVVVTPPKPVIVPQVVIPPKVAPVSTKAPTVISVAQYIGNNKAPLFDLNKEKQLWENNNNESIDIGIHVQKKHSNLFRAVYTRNGIKTNAVIKFFGAGYGLNKTSLMPKDFVKEVDFSVALSDLDKDGKCKPDSVRCLLRYGFLHTLRNIDDHKFQPFIIYDLMEGTIAELLVSTIRLAPQERRNIYGELILCEAAMLGYRIMHHMHEKDIYHFDYKLENLLYKKNPAYEHDRTVSPLIVRIFNYKTACKLHGDDVASDWPCGSYHLPGWDKKRSSVTKIQEAIDVDRYSFAVSLIKDVACHNLKVTDRGTVVSVEDYLRTWPLNNDASVRSQKSPYNLFTWFVDFREKLLAKYIGHGINDIL